MVGRLKVGVVGAGYVGLVTGACLARVGHEVVCVDHDKGRVAELEAGRVPIYEPGLEALVARGAERGLISFAGPEGMTEISRSCDVVFIAVGTPQDEDGSADLSNVAAVAQSIGAALAASSRERPLLIVNKSTVPVGSGDYVSMLVREGAGSPVEFHVASNPEFLREGSAVHDSLFPDRIVVGAECSEALDAMRALYAPIVDQSFDAENDPRPRTPVPFVTTDLASAEMIKYAANAFLAAKISLINEVSNLCELTGADVSDVATGIGLDDRIGPRFLSPGVGWGGSCFPKDVAALRSIAREYNHETPMLDATVAVNERQRQQVISKLQADLRTLKGKRVALLGLAFKPDTDDLREAPSLEIAAALEDLGARVVGYDPVAGEAAATLAPGLQIASDPYEALAGAHAAVVMTEWDEVRGLDLARAASLLEPPKLLVDGRNALDPEKARARNLLYRGFGRGHE